MVCLWIVLRCESQIVDNSPLLGSCPTLSSFNQPTLIISEHLNHLTSWTNQDPIKPKVGPGPDVRWDPQFKSSQKFKYL